MKINVFESQIDHISDAIFWIDGGSRHMGIEKASPISGDITMQVITAPPRLKIIHKKNAIVLKRAGNESTVTGLPTLEERTKPDESDYIFSASVKHSNDLYNPRLIQLTLGSGNGQNVWLYPSISKQTFSRKTIFGNLSFDDDTPARWAILELTVEFSPEKSVTLYSQSDKNGDFDLPLIGLPTRPKSIVTYEATLRIKANKLSESALPDPDEFDAMEIGKELDEEDEIEYEDELSFDLNPDQRTRIVTDGADHLYIKLETED